MRNSIDFKWLVLLQNGIVSYSRYIKNLNNDAHQKEDESKGRTFVILPPKMLNQGHLLMP